MIVLPHINAGAILADPPIPFATWSPRGEGRSPQHHYRCLNYEELASIPIANVAAPNCFLFLWVPLRSVFLVEPLMQAWGFEFSGSAFCWAKQNKSGICWLGRRGKPKRISAGVRELIIAPVREHSRKPDEVYMRIEEFCAGPYLELFARQCWPGWTCVGDESQKFQVAS